MSIDREYFYTQMESNIVSDLTEGREDNGLPSLSPEKVRLVLEHYRDHINRAIDMMCTDVAEDLGNLDSLMHPARETHETHETIRQYLYECVPDDLDERSENTLLE
jgi:hypothetical protein